MNHPSSKTAGSLRIGRFELVDLLVPVVGSKNEPIIFCTRPESTYHSQVSLDVFHAGEKVAAVNNSNIYPAAPADYGVRIESENSILYCKRTAEVVFMIRTGTFVAEIFGEFSLANGCIVSLPLAGFEANQYHKLYQPLVAADTLKYPRKLPGSATSQPLGRPVRNESLPTAKNESWKQQ